MSLTDIKTGFFKAISSAGLGDVAWPNIPYSGKPPYLRVTVLPAQTESVGISSIDRMIGIIQIDCVVAAGGGDISASEKADDVIAAFPRLTRITEGTTTIEINRTGWAGPSQQEPDELFIPVTIEYEVIK